MTKRQAWSSTLSLCDEIDDVLPSGGLARDALHELLVTDPGAAAAFDPAPELPSF